MILASAFALFAFAAAPDVSYAWPLDLPRVVTSSFAEYRYGRFHAGIDLHTGGIGQPVHAPADGHFARVSCSPWGYGKAIFLELSDGNTVVFGHLSSFCPVVDDYVRKIQHEQKSYSLELTPESSQFPVKRGDVVAFSGDTGVGPSHLHYEIRGPGDSFTNPCLLGATWPDATAPVIRGILAVPEAGSTVNGDILPAVLPVRNSGSGRYTCAALRANGKIGIGVELVDPANGGGTRLGIYRVRTFLDNTEVFKLQMDRFLMENRFNEALSYYPFPVGQDGGPFLLQWRWPGNDCEMFNQTKSDGWIDVPERAAEIRIEVADFAENKATLVIPLQPDSAEVKPPVTKAGKAKGDVDVACVGTWLVVTAHFDAPEGQAPELDVEGGASPGNGFRRINASTFRAAARPAPEAEEIVLRVRHERISSFEQRINVFHRGRPERSIECDGATVTVFPESPCGTLYMRHVPSSGNDVASARGRVLRLWPAAMPIDKPVAITFPRLEGTQDLGKLAVYRGSGEYWSYDNPVASDGAAAVRTRRLGAFAILEDDRPPSISGIAFEKGTSVASKRPRIEARISDSCSGIEETDVLCNGQWLLFAYDPERGTLAWQRDEDLPPGPKEFVFTLRDKAGNVSSLSKRLDSAPAKSAVVRSSKEKRVSSKESAAASAKKDVKKKPAQKKARSVRK